MAVTIVSAIIAIMVNGLRCFKDAGIIHTSIQITESDMELAARFFLGLWTSPWLAAYFCASLIFSLLWLYFNYSSIKSRAKKMMSAFSANAENYFS